MSNAKRIADELDSAEPNFYGESSLRFDMALCDLTAKAADELRRLDAVNAELLDALQACIDYGAMTGADWVVDKARAAIAKATGGAA